MTIKIIASFSKLFRNTVEIEILQVFDLEDLVAVGNLGPDRAAGGQCHHLAEGKLSLDQDIEHGPADIAGCSDHRDFIGHASPALRRQQY